MLEAAATQAPGQCSFAASHRAPARCRQQRYANSRIGVCSGTFRDGRWHGTVAGGSASSASGRSSRSARAAASSQQTETVPAEQQQQGGSWSTDAARAACFSIDPPDQPQPVAAEVSGRLPEWLRGSFIRNGPADFSGMRAKHMFDGFALLSKFQLDGPSNAVAASHRHLQSAAYRHYAETGRLRWREFGTPVPHESLAAKLADVAGTALGALGIGQGVTDNASVSVLPRPGGQLWAMTETVVGTYAVDAASLDTLQQLRYDDSIRGDLTTAHPTLLPSGDLINLISTVGLGFQVYRLPASGGSSSGSSSSGLLQRQLVATVPHRRPLSPAWIHDFPCSNRYCVIPETPLYFNLGALLAGAETEHIFMDWRPQDGARLHVVDLETGAVRVFETDPFFVFHWANAFESADGRFLHLDASVYDDPTICSSLHLDNVRAGPGQVPQLPPAYLRRLTIDLQAPPGSSPVSAWEPLVEDESSYGPFSEFPAVGPASRGRPYRYAWGSAARHPTNVANALARFDLEARSCKVWHEAGSLVGEPIFVPAPDQASEDDGVVLSVLSQADGRAALLVLDGRSHEEIARAVLPYGLPTGFHGCWVPA